MYCNAFDCANTDESIKITINENKPNEKDYTVDYNTIGNKSAWQNKSLIFETEQSSIDVRKILLLLYLHKY